MIEESKQRFAYIDIYKAIGIIFMVMGHIGFGDVFDFFIHAFHMPMFFFVSGFLYKEKDVSFQRYVIKKTKTLLIPYLFFGIINFVVCNIIYGMDISPLMHLFWDNSDGLKISGALWFLTAIYFTDIIFAAISRKIKNLITLGLISFGIATLGMILQLLEYNVPLSFGAGCVGVFLFYLGYLCSYLETRGIVTKILNMKIWQLLCFASIEIAFIFTNKPAINMRGGTYAFIPLFWLNALFSSLILINVSRLLCKILDYFPIIKNFSTTIGKDSIVFLGFNQLVIFSVKYVLGYLGANNRMPLLIYLLVVLLLVIATLYIITVVMTKTKLRHFIGK